MNDICRRTFVVLLLLGSSVELCFSKTVSNSAEPCTGENCPHRDDLDPVPQGHESVVENMVQMSDENTEETGRTKEIIEETKVTTNGENKHGVENIEESDETGGNQQPEGTRTEPKEEGQGQNQLVEKPAGKNAANDGGQPEVERGHESPAEHGHGIDPESSLRPNDGGHTQGPEVEPEEPHRFEPDAEKKIHGGAEDVHSDTSPHEEDQHPTDPGPDTDAILHGGDKHVHSPEGAERPAEELNSYGEFGVDPEGVLHDGVHVHAHKDRGVTDGETGEGGDYATDIDAILHGGDKHVHTHGGKEENTGEIPEVPIGATDPEALIHGGDGHVHDRARPSERTDREPRPYGAQDPESALHGSDDHGHKIQQAMEGSRHLPSDKDPDVSTTDVNPQDVKIGTLRPEDSADYQEWKTEKKQQADSPSNSWFSRFSYLKDAIWRDLQAAKKRFLEKFWSKDGAVNPDDDDDKPVRTIHDEQ